MWVDKPCALCPSAQWTWTDVYRLMFLHGYQAPQDAVSHHPLHTTYRSMHCCRSGNWQWSARDTADGKHADSCHNTVDLHRYDTRHSNLRWGRHLPTSAVNSSEHCLMYTHTFILQMSLLCHGTIYHLKILWQGISYKRFKQQLNTLLLRNYLAYLHSKYS